MSFRVRAIILLSTGLGALVISVQTFSALVCGPSILDCGTALAYLLRSGNPVLTGAIIITCLGLVVAIPWFCVELMERLLNFRFREPLSFEKAQKELSADLDAEIANNTSVKSARTARKRD